MRRRLVHARLLTPLGRVTALATEHGLAALCLDPDQAARRAGLLARLTGCTPRRDPAGLAPYFRDLEAYFLGDIQEFPTPVDLLGVTPFQEAVLQVVRSIPYGQTRSYQWVAARAGSARACRAAAAACGANPVPLWIPCHRVVPKNGGLGGYTPGVRLKAWLLDHERAHVRRP